MSKRRTSYNGSPAGQVLDKLLENQLIAGEALLSAAWADKTNRIAYLSDPRARVKSTKYLSAKVGTFLQQINVKLTELRKIGKEGLHLAALYKKDRLEKVEKYGQMKNAPADLSSFLANVVNQRFAEYFIDIQGKPETKAK